ncbi:hypothetical protein Q1695_000561 [Nippostrongylus brasiliensis]|nr:hypothetical protein Q1695_000561 [Nippostrongylus brasiliensis]
MYPVDSLSFHCVACYADGTILCMLAKGKASAPSKLLVVIVIVLLPWEVQSGKLPCIIFKMGVSLNEPCSNLIQAEWQIVEVRRLQTGVLYARDIVTAPP